MVLGLCVFLGLEKIRRSHIHSTEIISYQKYMSEGIVVKIAYVGNLEKKKKMLTSENHTTEICRNQGPGCLYS